MGEEGATIYGATRLGIFGIDTCGERIEGKPFDVRVPIAKQQEAITGFAHDFGMSGDMVTDLLDGEFFIVGHSCDDLSGGLYDKAEKGVPVECHDINGLLPARSGGAGRNRTAG